MGYLQQMSESGPSCICGSKLLRVSATQRIQLLVKHCHPDIPQDSPTFQLALDRAAYTCLIWCDLCNCDVAGKYSVWTCPSGNGTIMHTLAYDICDSCVLLHAPLTGEQVPEPQACSMSAPAEFTGGSFRDLSPGMVAVQREAANIIDGEMG